MVVDLGETIWLMSLAFEKLHRYFNLFAHGVYSVFVLKGLV